MNRTVAGSDDDEPPGLRDCDQCGAAVLDNDPVWTHYEWCIAESV